MAEITAQLVKELRDKSGAGMMDCKKALTENAGDMEQAIDWLRTKGLSKAAKKSDRVAAEGLVAVALDNSGKGGVGAAIELNSETDFVARNELFQAAARQIAQTALSIDGGVEAINAANCGDSTVADVVTNLIATIGENMMVRRAARFAVAEGSVSAYIHNATTPELGRIGVLVALNSAASDKAALIALGRKIGMHVAATQPQSLSTEDLDPAAVERERAIFTEQALASGKPPAVVEKMVEGRIRKFYEEVVLLKQAFVMNPDQTIEKLLIDEGKALGAPITIAGFTRLGLGEGVEKKTEDFAAEVASLTGQG
ncbi:MAG TPA: translation elongation factor Ts [Caulobacteraceae bacterium]|jgi:elongation factor Ts|nr:translation elongation factor Ts [Caulobacteraceae bacterium]